MKNFKIPKFIKWAGGKTQLINQFIPLFPKTFNNYYEPFVGSGAVFFYIVQKYKPKKILISDINEELINTYEVIRDSVNDLINLLKEHKKNHMKHSKKYYLKIRSLDTNQLSKIERAARFIYLNKTCYNGLYRVNSKGEFNVPMGKYKNPDIVQEEKLKFVSKLLKNVIIKAMSFENVLLYAEEKDFIYLDPPYYPSKKGKNFTAYTKENFLEKEQIRLSEVSKKLDKKGCYVMLSNSDTKFIKDLYKGFNIYIVKANRAINSNAKGRGKINELVITNY